MGVGMIVGSSVCAGFVLVGLVSVWGGVVCVVVWVVGAVVDPVWLLRGICMGRHRGCSWALCDIVGMT